MLSFLEIRAAQLCLWKCCKKTKRVAKIIIQSKNELHCCWAKNTTATERSKGVIKLGVWGYCMPWKFWFLVRNTDFLFEILYLKLKCPKHRKQRDMSKEKFFNGQLSKCQSKIRSEWLNKNASSILHYYILSFSTTNCTIVNSYYLTNSAMLNCKKYIYK